MKKTFEEKIKSKQLHIAKTHPFAFKVSKIWYKIVLAFYHFGILMNHNSKRLILIAIAILFFCVNSSFASPVLAQKNEIETMLNQTNVGDFSTIDFAVETDGAGDISDEDIIDDSVVIDGYDEEQLKNVDSANQYSVDDILNNNDFSSKDYQKTDPYAEYEFDKDDWRLVLINKQHPIPDDYEMTLVNIYPSNDNMRCDARIIDDLLAMLQAAKDDGVNLRVCSPYRDYAYQVILFNRKINLYMGNGMSYMDAYRLASEAVTVPGASEHQLGLSLDMLCDNYSVLDEGFGETEAGLWLKEHSCEYGFILRYPKGKEYITSIQYEPWHFRYVGVQAATVIMEQGITLEEFVESLE